MIHIAIDMNSIFDGCIVFLNSIIKLFAFHDEQNLKFECFIYSIHLKFIPSFLFEYFGVVFLLDLFNSGKLFVCTGIP